MHMTSPSATQHRYAFRNEPIWSRSEKAIPHGTACCLQFHPRPQSPGDALRSGQCQRPDKCHESSRICAQLRISKAFSFLLFPPR
jgi:hypothetical protein